MAAPTASIITVMFNGADVLPSCLDSIARQQGPLEHIIVDGQSTDGTFEIAQAYAAREAQRNDRTVHLIREPDQGPYDAMNKGLAAATGDIIGILNSDDFYQDDQVVMRAVSSLSHANDACYGDLDFVERADPTKVVRRWRAGRYHPKSLYWGWMPPHPTLFVRKQVYAQHGTFRLDLGSAADYELMLRFLLVGKISLTYIPEVLVRMRIGGLSTASMQNRLRANIMDRKAWTVNHLRPYPWTLFCKPLRKLGQFWCR